MVVAYKNWNDPEEVVLPRMVGQVLEHETNRPIAGAIVVMRWEETQGKIHGRQSLGYVWIDEVITNDDGLFVFESVTVRVIPEFLTGPRFLAVHDGKNIGIGYRSETPVLAWKRRVRPSGFEFKISLYYQRWESIIEPLTRVLIGIGKTGCSDKIVSAMQIVEKWRAKRVNISGKDTRSLDEIITTNASCTLKVKEVSI